MPWAFKSVAVVAAASASIGLAGWGWRTVGAAPQREVPREEPSRRPSDEEPPPRPRDEGAGPLVPVGPLKPNKYILPMDRSYLTRAERLRLYQEPGEKFIRRGPKGRPFYDSGFTIKPYDEDQFHVNVVLGFHADDVKTITPEERELVKEAQRTIKADRPENPDRAATFPRGLVSIPIPKLGTDPTEYEPSAP
ncbi:hypothetical protein [Paludisphaera soli]|uniref:hypothetical protein n=1 Tax=Paludisphaera soli TaxID=2712865 RepID=UPI0013EAB20A|nr:hypothetical protein [Paludisphaera soli]